MCRCMYVVVYSACPCVHWKDDMQKHTHTLRNTNPDIKLLAHIHFYIHTHTHIHTYIYTYIHTQTERRISSTHPTFSSQFSAHAKAHPPHATHGNQLCCTHQPLSSSHIHGTSTQASPNQYSSGWGHAEIRIFLAGRSAERTSPISS